LPAASVRLLVAVLLVLIPARGAVVQRGGGAVVRGRRAGVGGGVTRFERWVSIVANTVVVLALMWAAAVSSVWDALVGLVRKGVRR
jgi:hypothetical protein